MGKGKKHKFQEGSGQYTRPLKNVAPREGKREPFIVFSFQNFDRNQGQSFEEWEQDNLLAKAMGKIHAICNLRKQEAITQQIIKQYPPKVFPPVSDFIHPNYIPTDIAWCSMHIQGKECVIGYFEDNIFHIVFLDKDHRFWVTEKKHT
jgi:hypothetical protein